MSLIIDKIKKIKKLYHAKGCTFKQIKNAQLELGIAFPEEYIDIVKEYGAISFYLNVVSVTKKEKAINSSFPADCFVLENQGIDGLVIICNETGEVFSLQYSKIEKIHNSISNYLDECIQRNK